MPFRAVVSRYEEQDDAGLDAEALTLARARGKAAEVARRSGIPSPGAVLGADTAVVVDGRVLGKPSGPDDARGMLGLLAGRDHDVVTAVALLAEGREQARCERARVRFRALGSAEIDWYLGTGEWRDRAGGYAVQGAGAALVERIEGAYTTVVGLPVATVATMLAEVGLAPWQASGPSTGA